MAGMLIDGQWKTQDEFADDDGAFKRQDSSFRDWVTPDGENAPEGKKAYKAESGRYHLYVSYACPWANRALIMRRLKGLEGHIDVSVVHPYMLDKGWTFDDDFEGATGDRLYGFDRLSQIYTKAKPDYTGKVTVPVLWDKQSETIVNNESSEILRILNSGFNDLTGNDEDYYPQDLRGDIDDVNEQVYHGVNNGVYKAGFATKQDVYQKEVTKLFDVLDHLEERLEEGGPYLCGARFTEADIRLFVTLVRFDAVYVGHFKCNIKRIEDYQSLQAYLERVYAMPGVGETVHMNHIQHHYYYSHETLNPHRIVPKGPDLSWLNSR